MKKMYALSLIEVCVAMVLLSCLGGVSIFVSKGLIDRHRFSYGCALLQRELMGARRLAVASGADIEVSISNIAGGGGACVERSLDEPPVGIISQLYTYKTKLPLVCVENAPCKYLFSSSGAVLPKDTVQLISKDRKLKAEINPVNNGSQSNSPTPISCH